MRGIEPNKNVTSFSPHLSCLRDATAIHLPPRGKALKRSVFILPFRPNHCGGTRASRPTDGFAAIRSRCHFDRSEDDSPNAVEKSPAIDVFYPCTQVSLRFREIAAVALLPRNDNTISVYARF